LLSASRVGAPTSSVAATAFSQTAIQNTPEVRMKMSGNEITNLQTKAEDRIIDLKRQIAKNLPAGPQEITDMLQSIDEHYVGHLVLSTDGRRLGDHEGVQEVLKDRNLVFELVVDSTTFGSEKAGTYLQEIPETEDHDAVTEAPELLLLQKLIEVCQDGDWVFAMALVNHITKTHDGWQEWIANPQGSKHLHPPQNALGWTALHVAVWKYHVKVVKVLIRMTPELVDAQDARGRTALHCAAMKYDSDDEIALALIEEMKANPESILKLDNFGLTAFQIAKNIRKNGPIQRALSPFNPNGCMIQ